MKLIIDKLMLYRDLGADLYNIMGPSWSIETSG